MAYDATKHVNLGQLATFSDALNATFATITTVNALSDKVDDLVTTGGEPNIIESVKVNGTALTVTNKAVDIELPAYSIVKDETSADYAAVYHLTKDGTNTGVAINIPKDMVVQSGSVVTNPDGQDAGTYLKLVLANATNDTIYIPVDSLIEYVTSGSATGDMIVVAVNETTHKVTATITDGTVTRAKLDAAVEAILAKAEAATEGATKVEKSETNGNIKIDGVETTVYTAPTHTAYTADLYKITVDATGAVTNATAVTKADLDTLIGKASATADGLMSKKDFSKLTGISEGANKVAASTTVGNILIDNVETTVVPLATDAEVAELLSTKFGYTVPTT